MNNKIMGIDVSKHKLDCALINDLNIGKSRSKVVPNTDDGFYALIQWLKKKTDNDLAHLHIVMEATGVYHEAVAYFLAEAGFTLYVVNPADAAKFTQSCNVHKTDKTDSKALAQFGIQIILHGHVRPWQPEPKAIRELKALISRLDALEADLQRERNRMEKAEVSSASISVIQSIEVIQQNLMTEIKRLKQHINNHIDRHPQLKQDVRLLKSIPGVGEVVALRMTTLYRSRTFQNAGQMSAYVGLVPRLGESGLFRGRSMISKRGNPIIRAKLYMGAVVAKQYNPDIRRLIERLLTNGKTMMQALVAGMRRIVHICFGVLKHQREYQPQISM
ncbi:IS110 family transposase [Testudinibacter aquarius]|nr:IS110 family transposase [Testudinibacter aquarius]KAE9529975.1 hypothetical protein A1D24_07585 [Testudinibacter aquarius]TNG91460.1 IS110 family transposase [Testudinibacter aquarius]